MRSWASWWLALQQPAGGRSQMADGEGREGRWWPVGGLARTKPAALRATRLHPCVVTLGLASNTPRRRPLNGLRHRGTKVMQATGGSRPEQFGREQRPARTVHAGLRWRNPRRGGRRRAAAPSSSTRTKNEMEIAGQQACAGTCALRHHSRRHFAPALPPP